MTASVVCFLFILAKYCLDFAENVINLPLHKSWSSWLNVSAFTARHRTILKANFFSYCQIKKVAQSPPLNYNYFILTIKTLIYAMEL